MAGYSARVRQDIARWVQAGLIDAQTAAALTRDVEANERRSLSFGAILAMMAALLLGAAILLFVAANWEAFPRLARVGILFAIILVGYVGGAWLKTRGQSAFAEAAWVVAAAAFGGSIALIGQMYHFSGDESGAIFTWWVGTALAAVLLRSNPLTVMGIGIAGGWLVMKLLGSFDLFRGFDVPHLYLIMAAVVFIFSYWTRSRTARHLVILSLIAYAAFLSADTGSLRLPVELAAVSAGLFALAVFAAEPVEGIVQMGGRLPPHGLIGFLAGMIIVQIELVDEPGFVLASAVALAGIAAAVVLAGRESRALRWVAYLGFAVELCVIYAVTMQSMLGTAGFFLAAAVILGILAAIIIRVEKGMAKPALQGGAAP